MAEIEIKAIKEEDQQIVVIADMPDHENHTIIIPFEAIGARMVMYNLDNPQEAFDAIVREHWVRLHPEIETPINKFEMVARIHRDKDEFFVKHCNGIEHVIEGGIEAIKQAYQIRISQEEQP